MAHGENLSKTNMNTGRHQKMPFKSVPVSEDA